MKIISNILLIILIVFLIGCVNETDLEITIENVETTPIINGLSASSGYKFVMIELFIENKGSDEVHVNPVSMQLVDTEGGTYSHSEKTYRLIDSFTSVNLREEHNTEGIILFEIPEDREKQTLYYNDEIEIEF